MSVELKRVAPREKNVLWRLMQLCMHDYSEFDRFEIGSDGKFNYHWFDAYFKEAHRYPYFIRVGGQLGGFVMVRESNGEEDWDFQIAEFFILRRYRRTGIGRDAARKTLSLLSGKWSVSFDDANTPAVYFWRAVAGEYENVVLQREPGQEKRGRYLITIAPTAASQASEATPEGAPPG